tara:strand:+ start:152 stop:538 length:387 start_codon:yes stop_codon:yes gene_type:complete
MPFKDPEKRREYNRRYQKEYYRKNIIEMRQKVKDRKREIRKWFDDYKRQFSCEVCGFSGAECSWSLEFHHRDPSEKDNIIAYMVGNAYSKKRIKEEIEKCAVLCANHHRQLHYNERQAHLNEMADEEE